SQLPRLASTSCGRDVFAPAGLTAEQLRQVRQPVVALYDEHTSFQATREFLATNLKNVCVEIVPGAQHVAPLQNTDAFVHLVQKHCRALNEALWGRFAGNYLRRTTRCLMSGHRGPSQRNLLRQPVTS